MIGNITYTELSSIIESLNDSNNNISLIVSKYKDNYPNDTVRMERFVEDVNSYVEYLKTLLEINENADEVLERIRELNK